MIMSRATSVALVVVLVVGLSGVIVCVLLLAAWWPSGPRTVRPLESIAGVPYPLVDGRAQVYEHLAHADIALDQPVVGRELTLTITFIPHRVQALAIGIRENSFWLSYPWQTFYEAAGEADVREPRTATVTIPLTDKLADRDQSLDLMILATPPGSLPPLEDRMSDDTWWEAVALTADVQPAALRLTRVRDLVMIADYVTSLVRRERVL